MNVSGTLHFYSGADKELFFVFDDDVAQGLYSEGEFDLDNIDTRRCYISVGDDRFIHRRTMSFSRKQTEIKMSLCSKTTKSGLGALTSLYDWYGSRGGSRPDPFRILGTLNRMQHGPDHVWELHLTEPVDLIVPPGFERRKKIAPPERKSFENRRVFAKRDVDKVGRAAEELAIELAQVDYEAPELTCLWRDAYLDSERIEIRKMGVIADIDVWNEGAGVPAAFLEIKAQKVLSSKTPPAFYLSVGEWRGYRAAERAGIPYAVWLFRYRELADFTAARHRLELMVFETLDEAWLDPDGYLVRPAGNGKVYTVS
jgi:hypothetical protein